MRIGGEAWRTIWVADDGETVEIIDQTRLPHALRVARLCTPADAERAIREMWVRGAPLIGVTAAYGVCLALRDDPSDASLEGACQRLLATRPTAVNLRWALEAMRETLADTPPGERVAAAWRRAAALADEDAEQCRAIGLHGAALLEEASRLRRGEPVEVLTHCNAGWLATVDWGTALAPVYVAHDRGVPVHVWVDETRPRSQGALTAWELAQHGVPHTLVVDNAGGHLMRAGRVHLCMTGSDRTTAGGDVCNKIGTYQKALAARDTGVPFYVALPHSTIDWTLDDGAKIPIEERDPVEVTRVWGRAESGERLWVSVVPEGSPVANPAFDVTPARLVTGLVTERGVCEASREGLLSLYPERRAARG